MIRRSTLLAVALLFLFQATALAKAPQVRVLDYGLTTFKVVSVEEMANATTGEFTKTEQAQVVERTGRVPAKVGVEFGFTFVVEGVDQGEVTLQNKYTFPPLDVPGEGKQSSATFDRSYKVGETSYAGYGFEEDWECVPGAWTFQLYYEGKLLGEKTFQVYKP